MLKTMPENFTLDRYGLHTRLVDISDSEFILSIRTNEKLSKHIHPTRNSIECQKKWIMEYKKREAEGEDFYFIFEKPKGVRLGVCRIYSITESSFTTGSWVFAKNAPMGAGILGDIITKEIAFYLYPKSKQLFDIRKENVNVIGFAKSFHPIQIGEDKENLYFENTKMNFDKYKERYIKIYTSIK